jgi:hypothetical protein
MLIKRTAKNQVTLPVRLLEQLPPADYFSATVEHGRLVLRPVRLTPAETDPYRTRLEALQADLRALRTRNE